jgi:hypothetical protein
MALLKSTPRMRVDFRERVMSEIHSAALSHTSTQSRHIAPQKWRTGRLRFGIAALSLLAISGFWIHQRETVAVNRQLGQSSVQLVRFVLIAPQAHEVSVTGSFNKWSTTPLHRVNRAGTWIVDVPLPVGRYPYMFVVNGDQWIADPATPDKEPSDFGSPNSIITVAVGAEI